ncbi:hypothetical protein CO665_27475 [Rhizobium anhuiense]|nr:hypothetical protein CO665_27475 [Rhizobium anhuiense]
MALLFCGIEFPAPRSRLLLPQQSPEPPSFRHFRHRSPLACVYLSGRPVARPRWYFESGGRLFNA